MARLAHVSRVRVGTSQPPAATCGGGICRLSFRFEKVRRQCVDQIAQLHRFAGSLLNHLGQNRNIILRYQGCRVMTCETVWVFRGERHSHRFPSLSKYQVKSDGLSDLSHDLSSRQNLEPRLATSDRFRISVLRCGLIVTTGANAAPETVFRAILKERFPSNDVGLSDGGFIVTWQSVSDRRPHCPSQISTLPGPQPLRAADVRGKERVARLGAILPTVLAQQCLAVTRAASFLVHSLIGKTIARAGTQPPTMT